MKTIKAGEKFKFIRTEQYMIEEKETEAYISWDDFTRQWKVNTPRERDSNKF